jgi:hypothetical protein
VVDRVGIKLAKCGSLREALRMIAVTRAHGMRDVRLHDPEHPRHCGRPPFLAARGADLDGAALLAGDPFVGVDSGRPGYARRHARTACAR